MNKDIENFASLLTKVGNYREVINTIVHKSLEIMGSDRSCLIIRTKEGDFRIEDGVPEAAHGIGTILSEENGKDFFNDLINGGCHELVKDLSKVSYMAGYIEQYNITSLLAIPLFYQNQPMGVLVLDFVQGHEISDGKLSKVKSLGHIAALAIWLDQHKKEMRERSKFFLIAQNTAQVAHDAKNTLTRALGFSDWALENLKDFIDNPEKKEFLDVVLFSLEKARENIKESVDYFNQIKQGIRPKEPKFQAVDISEFLESEIITLSRCWPNMSFYTDFENGENLTVGLDSELMSNCHYDLVANAFRANARNFTIKTNFTNQEVKISYINDGDAINPNIINRIFNPFETTKDDGWGVGLVNVKNIIEKIHKGKIEVENIQDGVMFTVTFPIEQ